MIVFEYVPNDFGNGILIPIPKNTTGKGDVTTENYKKHLFLLFQV